MSLLAAVNRVRLRTAHFALEQENLTLADVAERTGFQSPYSFSNWFVKQTGQRPGEYRRMSAERRLALRTEEPWILPRSKPQPR
jgi:transcriptional regulator GlxA family with amidase domain